MTLLDLLLGFLKIGCFSFGGAYGAIPLIREVSLSHGWLDEAQLANMIAVSESTPGPIMVNMATYIGFSQAGIPGALVATASVVFPAFLIVILLMALLKNALQNDLFRTMLGGLKSCVAGIVLATGLFLILTGCFGSVTHFRADLTTIILTVILGAVYFGSKKIRRNGMSPILLIGLSAAAGIMAYGWR